MAVPPILGGSLPPDPIYRHLAQEFAARRQPKHGLARQIRRGPLQSRLERLALEMGIEATLGWKWKVFLEAKRRGKQWATRRWNRSRRYQWARSGRPISDHERFAADFEAARGGLIAEGRHAPKTKVVFQRLRKLSPDWNKSNNWLYDLLRRSKI